jgi:hypothetical protein
MSAAPNQCAELAQIEAELKALGYGMGPSLSCFDGEGHDVIGLATGESVDPPAGRVLQLAEEWSRIVGVFT